MAERTRRAVAYAALAGGLLLALAGLHALLRERIAAAQHAAELAALAAVLPPDRYDDDPLAQRTTLVDAAAFGTSRPIEVLHAHRAGKPSALVLRGVVAQGYVGGIVLEIGVAHDGSVLGVRVLQQQETPGFGDAAAEPRWLAQFRGRSADAPSPDAWRVRKDGGEFDEISGATITPRAIVGALRRALDYVAAHRAELEL